MPKKQLCQIQIEAGAGGVLPARRYYQCGLNGRYRAHLVGIVWADKAGSSADNKLITVQSDCFRMPYGSSSQSISFCNRTEHNMGQPGGEFPIDIEVMGNNIDLSFSSSSAYTGSGSNIFSFGVLTFTVEPMDD
jgi:methyl coenzyme M reductase beta subunit